MSTSEHPKKATPVTTGRAFASLTDLLSHENTSPETREKVERNVRRGRVATDLAAMRTEAGMTQKEMAAKLGITQSAVPKL